MEIRGGGGKGMPKHRRERREHDANQSTLFMKLLCFVLLLVSSVRFSLSNAPTHPTPPSFKHSFCILKVGTGCLFTEWLPEVVLELQWPEGSTPKRR